MRTQPPPVVGSLALLGLLATVSSQLACKQDFQVTQVVATLAVDPGTVDMGLIAVGETATGTIDLYVDQGKLNVQSITVENIEGDFIVREGDSLPSLSVEEPATLTFSYTPTTEGFHWAEVHIVTDEGQEGKTWTLHVRGEAAQPDVRAYPAIIDFGAVEPGDTEGATVTLQNEGRVDLSLYGLGITGGVFDSALDVPADLPAGGSVEIPLTFAPTDRNAASGTLSFTFDRSISAPSIGLRGNDCETANGALYDRDQDGVSWCGGDCDDSDDSILPGVREVCDGVDQDCDGVIDEGTECYDDDGDGFSELDGDCNDGMADVNPDAEEVRGNGLDDDCNGTVDSADSDADHDGFSPDSGVDCDDSDPDVHPGAIETCDGIDEDCDGTTDEETSCFDDDGDGFTEDDGDCDDTDDETYPGARETADWVDNDCDGRVDEGTIHYDDDGDGFSEIGGDCDDDDDEASPALPEEPGDGIDNDCDGEVD